MCHKNGGYPSDLTDAQWVIIEGLDINKPWGPGRRMRLELRTVINAILYLLRTGCQWRYLPKDYPNYNSVYYHYHKWCWDGTWEAVNSALRERVRQAAGRAAQPSLAIIDSQSVKTTEVGGEHGFDGAKRVNGRKRHILVDTMGNLLKVLAHAANIGERPAHNNSSSKFLTSFGSVWRRSLPMGAMQGRISRTGSSRPLRLSWKLACGQPTPRALSWFPSAGWSNGLLLGWGGIAASARIMNASPNTVRLSSMRRPSAVCSTALPLLFNCQTPSRDACCVFCVS